MLRLVNGEVRMLFTRRLRIIDYSTMKCFGDENAMIMKIEEEWRGGG